VLECMNGRGYGYRSARTVHARPLALGMAWAAYQSDETGQCTGRLGFGALVPCSEESMACLMAQSQWQARSPPSSPSCLGAREREGKERAGGGLARVPGLWGGIVSCRGRLL
jgi:hypothetical protein